VADASDKSSVYAKDELNAELRQSEIITGIVQYTFDPTSRETVVIRHSFAVILSQDCDLKWDYEVRLKGEQSDLNGVLIFEAEPWANIKVSVGGRDIWKPLGQNKNDRYHLLEGVPPGCDLEGKGLPALVIDFKKMFTVPAAELDRQIRLAHNGAQRRCRLLVPYREHLQSRLAFYLQRVAIPEPHRVPVSVEQKALPKP
jgi:hypothetical protein